MPKHKKGPTPKSIDTRIEELKLRNEELRIQNTSFGLCLSALVEKYGRPVEVQKEGDDDVSLTGDNEYVFRVEDFHAVSGSQLTIESLPDVDGQPGTVVRVLHTQKVEAVS